MVTTDDAVVVPRSGFPGIEEVVLLHEDREHAGTGAAFGELAGA